MVLQICCSYTALAVSFSSIPKQTSLAMSIKLTLSVFSLCTDNSVQYLNRSCVIDVLNQFLNLHKNEAVCSLAALVAGITSRIFDKIMTCEKYTNDGSDKFCIFSMISASGFLVISEMCLQFHIRPVSSSQAQFGELHGRPFHNTSFSVGTHAHTYTAHMHTHRCTHTPKHIQS